MNVKDFYAEILALYPDELACEWDNDGIMCCTDLSAEVKQVLVALDATTDVLHYAAKHGFDTVLTHHPMIFKGISHVTHSSTLGENVIFCIRNGITVISLHTRLDAGKCGVNDCLAELLKLDGITVFGDKECPELGRVGTVSVSNEEFISTLKYALGLNSVNAYITRPINRVAVVGGSGKDYIRAAAATGADTYVTGECSYNAALDAANAGLNIIEAGHYHTEFPVCARLAELARDIAGADTEIYELKIPKQL